MLILLQRTTPRGLKFVLDKEWALKRTLVFFSPSILPSKRNGGRRMPPKKKEVEGPGPLLGRFGTSLKCGIVGLPNVGKSTFFNVLTKASAPAENFPFCTIDPNENKVAVPDSRYDFLCEHWKPPSCVPAYLHVVDIAGLVKGAHEGQGLGNAFLSNISACDAIFHVVRAFEDEDVTHVEGDVNPVRDLEIISEELRLKDGECLKKAMADQEKVATRGGDKKRKPEMECLVKVREVLEEEKKDIRFGTWSSGDIEVLNKHLFLTAKPVIYLVNLSEKDYRRKKNKWLSKIKEWVDSRDPHALIIPFSAGLELKLFDMPEDEKMRFCQETKTQSALGKIIATGYQTLNLQCFFYLWSR
ncbi:Obg-like ATPase 1 [Geodia barretti]|uniref:Obg-like ATPase 1 n=1 Tax=Geodia barretti TaxID=519541 RepID=A0AA35W7H3_GEOBA|nr:Obg-like ATPase 1 [Geodia barretti]